MKKFVFISASILIGAFGYAQHRVMIPKAMQNHGENIENPESQLQAQLQSIPPLKAVSYLEEDLGITYWDLQTNASIQKRIHVFDDGTIGAVWTMSHDTLGFPDRGTGYNYFDGENWQPLPNTVLESNRAGWPEYAPFGENGEIVVSHNSGTGPVGLNLLKRENKGMGEWEELNFAGPPDCQQIIWPRIATGGIDHQVIHLLAATAPSPNCAIPYQGQEVALLYSRSSDGGNTWDPENYLIPLIDSSHYVGFQGDVYDIRAEGNNVGILIGSQWTDLLLLKSTDGGDTWAKTIIWEHPYPMWNGNTPTDTFYCADGAHSLDFDDDGIAHVAFGINRTYCDGAGTYWFPAVGGIAYWNESRPTFSNNVNALSPYGDPGSELIEDYSLIGWTQDINGNGQLDILDDWGAYFLGFSSMPQIILDDFGNLVVVYASVTETYDNGVQNYRHLWTRVATNNGNWWGPFIDITDDLTHLYDECIYPSLAPDAENWQTFYLTYQRDSEPGLAIRGDMDDFTKNDLTYMKTDFDVGIREVPRTNNIFTISQNQPNPFSNQTKIKVDLFESCYVNFTMTTLTGQNVLETDKGDLQPGTHFITIDAKGIKPGIYFYTLKAGTFSITKKMIVQ